MSDDNVHLNFGVEGDSAYPTNSNNNNYSHEDNNASLEIARLLERTARVRSVIRSEVDKENELVSVVERLFQKVDSNTHKRVQETERMAARIEMDDSRSGHAKQLHEELTDQFMEFCKWHFVEPRFNIVWRAFNKIGLYLRVFLSFIFVVPFIAIYSKALRFFRRRIRGKIRKSASNNNSGRPGWSTLQRQHSNANAEHDFGGGLAQIVSNPLRFSGTSLRDELESMGNFSSDNSDTEDLRRFVVTTPTAITPTLIPTSKKQKPVELEIEAAVVEGDTDVDIEGSSTPPVSSNGTKRRSRNRDKTKMRSKEESSRPETDDNQPNGTDKRPRSGNVDVPSVPGAEEERASWAMQDNQESGWVDKDSQNSRDFWDSFGSRSRRSSRS